MLLHDGEQLQRHPAWMLGAGLPLLDGALAGVEVERKHRLADIVALAQTLDLLRRDGRRYGQAGFVEAAHRQNWVRAT